MLNESFNEIARAVIAYGIGCQQWKYILRPIKRCPHFRLFVSRLARSRMEWTSLVALRAHFAARYFQISNIAF